VLVLAALAAAALLFSATNARASMAGIVDASSIPVSESAGDSASGVPGVTPGGFAHVAIPAPSGRQAATLPHQPQMDDWDVARGERIALVDASASGSKTVAGRTGALARLASADDGKPGGAAARVLPRKSGRAAARVMPRGGGRPAAKPGFDWAPLVIFAGLLVAAAGVFFLRVRRSLARARVKGH
jgi:hypothetical protein